MRHLARALVLMAIAGPAATAAGFPWNKDMVRQVSPKAQTSQAPPAAGAVPTGGREVVPAPASEAALFAAKDEAAALPNPVPASAESVARGEALYQVHCAVCHGADGRGTGPVGRLFDPAPADLGDAYTQEQADGQLFFTLTRGRVAMPYYRDAMTPEERWHVVNYVRAAFGNRQ